MLKQVTFSASLVLAPPSKPKEIDSKVQRWSQVTELTGINNQILGVAPIEISPCTLSLTNQTLHIRNRQQFYKDVKKKKKKEMQILKPTPGSEAETQG